MRRAATARNFRRRCVIGAVIGVYPRWYADKWPSAMFDVARIVTGRVLQNYDLTHKLPLLYAATSLHPVEPRRHLLPLHGPNNRQCSCCHSLTALQLRLFVQAHRLVNCSMGASAVYDLRGLVRADNG